MLLQNRKAKLRKHINRKFNILKERINRNEMEMNHISTYELPADLLTKPLEEKKFGEFTDMILGYSKIPLMKNK